MIKKCLRVNRCKVYYEKEGVVVIETVEIPVLRSKKETIDAIAEYLKVSPSCIIKYTVTETFTYRTEMHESKYFNHCNIVGYGSNRPESEEGGEA